MAMSPRDRDEALVAMRKASSDFYRTATGIGNHPFIEFAGLINEYISICAEANEQGMDFSECSVHAGQMLPIRAHQLNYLNEKIECIFSGQLRLMRAEAAPPSPVGDTVRWRSQAGGFSKEKIGTIVAEVPARTDPRSVVPAGMTLKDPGAPRDHLSFLVQVGGSKSLYWPRTAALRDRGL